MALIICHDNNARLSEHAYFAKLNISLERFLDGMSVFAKIQ